MQYYVDVHSHIYEYDVSTIAEFMAENPLIAVGVSDDISSSIKVIRLSKLFQDRLYPCIGLHPWEVKSREAVDEARHIVELALEHGVKCLGEVGLDTKFVGETIELQREVFRVFLEAARDYNLFLNLHTAGTWEEVFGLLVRYDITAANFHWYTGPLHLLPEIEAQGYTISINPAVKIQQKHQNIVKHAPLSIVVTESDSPYEYRGLKLSPAMVIDAVKVISSIKGLDEEYVKSVIWSNFERKILERVRPTR